MHALASCRSRPRFFGGLGSQDRRRCLRFAAPMHANGLHAIAHSRLFKSLEWERRVEGAELAGSWLVLCWGLEQGHLQISTAFS